MGFSWSEKQIVHNGADSERKVSRFVKFDQSVHILTERLGYLRNPRSLKEGTET